MKQMHIQKVFMEMMFKYMKMVAFDIDGTLLPVNTHVLAQETKQAILELKAKDIKVVIATGRQYKIIPKEILELKFDYYLCGNGSLLCDEKGNILCAQEMEDTRINELINDFIRYNYPLTLRYPSGAVEVNPNVSLISFSKKFLTNDQIINVDQYVLNERPKNEKVYACAGYIDQERLEEFCKKYPDFSFVITGGGRMCDITLKGINKGKGLEMLCEYLGIELKDCLAFGDDANDIEMIKMAGIGVAMGNSLPIVKENADYVALDSDQLGVVHTLKHFNLVEERNDYGI